MIPMKRIEIYPSITPFYDVFTDAFFASDINVKKEVTNKTSFYYPVKWRLHETY